MDKMISEIADEEKVARIDDVSPDIDFSKKNLPCCVMGCISSNPPPAIIFTIILSKGCDKMNQNRLSKDYR